MRSKFYFIFLLLIAPAAFAKKTSIKCGKLIDSIAGTTHAGVAIIVDGEMITDIRKGYISGYYSDKVTDLKNKTAIPGLINCHTKTVSDDPLADIKTMKNIAFVMKEGKVYEQL